MPFFFWVFLLASLLAGVVWFVLHNKPGRVGDVGLAGAISFYLLLLAGAVIGLCWWIDTGNMNACLDQGWQTGHEMKWEGVQGGCFINIKGQWYSYTKYQVYDPGSASTTTTTAQKR